MLDFVFELIAGVLVGVLELIGEAVLEGIGEGFAKFVSGLLTMLAGLWNEICDWIQRVIA